MAFSIFLSHHETETSAANTFKAHVEDIGDDVEVHTFVQKAEPDFRNWIREKVLNADMLVFFYSDTTRRLDWHGFEVGMYWAARETRQCKVMVHTFMTPGIDAMPKVFDNLVGKPATAPNVEQFLRDLLLNGTYSENRVLARRRNGNANDQIISSAAADVAAQFRSRVIAEYFTDRICIGPIAHCPRDSFDGALDERKQVVREGLRDEEPMEYVLDFSHVRITGSDSILRLIGLPTGGDAKWVDLVQRERNACPSDCFSLPSEILDYSRDDLRRGQSRKLLSPVSLGGRVYQPVLSRIEKRDRLPLSFYVIFVEDTLSRTSDVQQNEKLRDSHDAHSKVVLLLNMARRFRWNILETYISRIRRAHCQGDDVRPVLEELDEALTELEREGENAGLDEAGFAAVSFPERHCKRLHALWLDYFHHRARLRGHIEAGKAMEVLEVLCTFQRYNSEFMSMALTVYVEFMESLPTLDEVAPRWREDFAERVDDVPVSFVAG